MMTSWIKRVEPILLLLGGTSETALMAESLAAAGYRVLVCTATDISLNVGSHPNIFRRSGRLDKENLIALIKEYGISAVVDVTHPYAMNIRAMAREVAQALDIPYLTLIRRGIAYETYKNEGIIYAADHTEAARLAFSFGSPVFLTTGSRNLAPYAGESRRTGLVLVVRVLPEAESIAACHAAGIADTFIITGRGPFSLENNRSIIRKFRIGVLVTKDSGVPGGVPDKLEAARLEGCRVVVVQRPQ